MPRVSIVLPVYLAEKTLGGCLGALRSQTFTDFDTTLVDSSPSREAERIARDVLPEARYLHLPERKTPHAASNLAASATGGDLLVFLDPDVYPRPDWLARLASVWEERGGVLVGGVACYGRRWLDLGAHFAKFGKWLPGGNLRTVPDIPTANLLVDRRLFDELGGFAEQGMHSDTDLSWRLRERGIDLWLVPDSVVEHHHLHTRGSLLSERFRRGRGYAALWMRWHRPSFSRLALWLLATLVPLRLASQLIRHGREAGRAGLTLDYLRTLPVVVGALGAWLLGEAAVYAGAPRPTE